MEQGFNACDDHVEGYSVETAFRNDYVGISFRGFNELLMHRTHSVQILVDDRFHRAPSFGNVALQPADKTNIGVRVDVDFYIKKITQPGFHENENALNDDDRLRLDGNGFLCSGMGFEVVNGQRNRPVGFELSDVLDEEIRI